MEQHSRDHATNLYSATSRKNIPKQKYDSTEQFSSAYGSEAKKSQEV